MNTLLVILLFLLLVSIIVVIIKATMRRYFDEYEEDVYEETVVTTEITAFEEKPFSQIVGNLKALLTTKGQRFVIDPVDGDTVFLNSNDDMYEDGAGKIWRLV